MDSYGDIMSKGDPRTVDWPLVRTPWPTLALCLSYAYFCKVIGPELMKNRKPFSLRNVLILYNFLQTIFSAWIFCEYLMSGWLGSYSFRCQPVDYSDSPMAMRMARTCWWYYFSKFTEFFDTLFFILRKKNEHVSTLHVIHHGCMPMSVWFGVKYAPGGHSTFFALVNTFVHIIMYSYYMVAAMGPEFQKYIWWKKYLTKLQMVQFVAIMTHQFQLLFTSCDYPREFVYWIGLHGVLFFFLFSDFYVRTYLKNQKKVKDNIRKNRKYENNNGTSLPAEENASRHLNKLQNGHYSKDENHFTNNCYANGFTPKNGFIKSQKSD